MISRLGILAMRFLARWPLPALRALGTVLGWVLYLVVLPRRRIVRTNLRLCFPHLPAGERERLVRRVFIRFAQAWIDRSWLWHAPPDVTRGRLHLRGELTELEGGQPTVLFAPHFVGLDAGWTAINYNLHRRFT